MRVMIIFFFFSSRRRHTRSLRDWSSDVCSSDLGGVLLWLVGLAFGEGSRLDIAVVSPRSILSLGYLIVFGSLLGFSAYVWLLRATTPSRVSTYAYVNPVVAVFLGWAFAGEAVTLRVALGTIAIVGAVALIIRYGGARAPTKSRKEIAA